VRKLVLQVAVSLDGYIEGPNGEYDWCFMDQDYGMSEFFRSIDSVFMGRKSYELALSMGNVEMPHPKLNEYIFSTTLKEVRSGSILIKEDVKAQVEKIKNQPGKDIWLFGGASLTASLMNLGLVDEINLAVHPIILGRGKPLLSNIKNRIGLKLISHKAYSTGLVSLTYTMS
jgi:dihydrofolate reductase